MSINDLQFTGVLSGDIIYDPLVVKSDAPAPSGDIEITIKNNGEDALTGLGIYLAPASNVGDVDNPAAFPPATDYNDLLEWGQRVADGAEASGGVYLTLTNNSGAWTGYVTRAQGAILRTKIPLIDLAAGASTNVTVRFETPPVVSARRFFVNLRVE
jgi:hypothetical protein